MQSYNSGFTIQRAIHCLVTFLPSFTVHCIQTWPLCPKNTDKPGNVTTGQADCTSVHHRPDLAIHSSCSLPLNLSICLCLWRFFSQLLLRSSWCLPATVPLVVCVSSGDILCIWRTIWCLAFLLLHLTISTLFVFYQALFVSFASDVMCYVIFVTWIIWWHLC